MNGFAILMLLNAALWAIVYIVAEGTEPAHRKIEQVKARLNQRR